jgi:hypothetical protein
MYAARLFANTNNCTKNLFEYEMYCMKVEYTRSYLESYWIEFSCEAFGKGLPPSETDQKVSLSIAMTVCSDLLIVPVISVPPPPPNDNVNRSK